MPSPGPLLIDDRYELGELIGAGGMGEVRVARDRRLDREVAVKLLHPALVERADMRERIRAEARAAARLAHPHAVAVFDAGIDQGRPYIVMERLEGRTLADQLSDGPLTIERARAMALQVLGALDAAHAIGLVHRDIKPGNVLIAGPDRWKVADFGIARWLDESGITRTGEVMGSPAYLAPERLDGSPASPATDLYSLGIVLYEALAGRRPADGDHPWAVAVAVRDGSVTPLSQVRPDVGPALERVVTTAMAIDPVARFPNARAMESELSRTAEASVPVPVPTEHAATTAVIPIPDETRPLPTSPPSPAESRRPLAKRPQPWIALAVVASLIVLVVFLVALRPQPGLGGDPASVTPGTELPAPLADALDRLEEAVP